MSDGANTEPNDAVEPEAVPVDAATLAVATGDLAREVKRLRADLRKTQRKHFWDRVAIGTLILVLALFWWGQRGIKQNANRDNEQAVGGLVANCAVLNVIKIELANYLGQALNDGVFTLPGTGEVGSSLSAQIDAANVRREVWLRQGYAHFSEVFDCKTLVHDDKMTITLEYPSTIPLAPPP